MTHIKSTTSVHLEWIAENKAYSGITCLRWPFSNIDWYHSVSLGGGRWSKAHRLMCIEAHGLPPKKGLFAVHSCDNKWCVNPNHLSWGTPTENSQQAFNRGLSLKGEKCSGSILTPETVRMARVDREAGMTYSQLAEKYRIAKGAIWHAVKGSQWSHIK